jgi:hypothetical protein
MSMKALAYGGLFYLPAVSVVKKQGFAETGFVPKK